MKKLLIGVFALLMLLPSLAFADTAVYGNGWSIDSSGNFVIGSSTTSRGFYLYGKQVSTASLSAATGDEVAYTLNYTVNKSSSGDDTGLLIAMTDTASPGSSYGIHYTVGGTSKFYVDSSGYLTCVGEYVSFMYGPTTQAFEINGRTGSKSNAYAINFKTNTDLSATSGYQGIVSITPTYNQTSGTAANTDLLINRTETAVGSGEQKLIDAQVGSASKFTVWNTGETALKNKEWVEAATDTLTAIQVSGGLINNYGQTDDETLTLPAAAAGYSFTVILGTTVAKYFRLDPNASDQIYLDGVAGGDGKYIGVASAAAGASIVCKTFQTGASAYDWACYTVSGAWSME